MAELPQSSIFSRHAGTRFFRVLLVEFEAVDGFDFCKVVLRLPSVVGTSCPPHEILQVIPDAVAVKDLFPCGTPKFDRLSDFPVFIFFRTAFSSRFSRDQVTLHSPLPSWN